MSQPFSTPKRQAPAAILFILLAFFWRMIKGYWPVLLIYFATSKVDSFSTKMAYIGVALSVFSTVASVLAYFRIFYYVENGDLILERGIFRRIRLSAPIDRIQTIDFEQGPLHRLLGVTKVNIDTAGSQGKEFSLTALRQSEAEALRKFLLEEKAAAPSPQEPLEGEEPLPESSHAIADERILLRSPADLMKIGLGHNHFRTGILIIGFFAAIFSQVQELLNIDYEEGAQKLLGLDFSNYWNVVMVTVPIFLLASVLGSMLMTVWLYYGLSCWRTGKGFRIESGLFNRKQQVLPFRRLQFLRWQTQPLMQLFGHWTLRFYQASATAVSKGQAARLPGSSRAEVLRIVSEVFSAEWDHNLDGGGLSPLIINRRVLFFGLIPTLLLSPLAILNWGWATLILLVWPPLVYLLARRYWRRYRFALNDEYLYLYHGTIGTIEQVMPWYKVQAVTLRQGIYQRRHQVADLILHTAAGAIRIPYLDLDTARRMENYALYKVEAERRDWM